MYTCTHFLSITSCHVQSLSPEKSTQFRQRTSGDPKASARQQRSSVCLEFWSQTKHVCAQRQQVAKTPLLCVCVCERELCASLSAIFSHFFPSLLVYLILNRLYSETKKASMYWLILLFQCVRISVYIRIHIPTTTERLARKPIPLNFSSLILILNLIHLLTTITPHNIPATLPQLSPPPHTHTDAKTYTHRLSDCPHGNWTMVFDCAVWLIHINSALLSLSLWP